MGTVRNVRWEDAPPVSKLATALNDPERGAVAFVAIPSSVQESPQPALQQCTVLCLTLPNHHRLPSFPLQGPQMFLVTFFVP